MNKIGVDKLSKFNDVANPTAQPDLIVRSLDHLFVLTKRAMNNLKVFFQQYAIESEISFHGEGDYQNLSETMLQDVQTRGSKLQQGSLVDVLPFYVNDTDWLANYFVTYLKKVEPTAVCDVAAMKAFIEASPAIKKAQLDYQSEIIKALIKFYMEKGLIKHNRIKNSRPRTLTAYEEIFRNKILCCADGIGIDHHYAELTLESNADLWRKQNMERTFNEFYYPMLEQPNDNENYLAWFQLAKGHRNAWLKCYEFEYGEKHSDIIREANQINQNAMTENMKVSHIRYAMMSYELTKFNEKRQQIVKASQQNNFVKNI